LCLGIVGVVLGSASLAPAQESAPAAVSIYNTLGLGGEGPNSFTDKSPGNDMLPYTTDDAALPENGNYQGTWSLAHFDNNSDDQIQEEEHIFNVIRRDDDDSWELSSLNRPEYGVLYESEDWWDYHDARNQGPGSSTVAFNPEDPSGWLGAAGNDFEHNDSSGWCGESNAFLYNNARANQHGEGKPRYYFELINPSNTDVEPAGGFFFDEIEGWEKTLTVQQNYNNPDTPEDERNGPGGCRRWLRTTKMVIRGYLIPVADLAGLTDGSLTTLFGWETVDLAAYLRDVIAPKLADADLNIFTAVANELGADPAGYLPPTHIMLKQMEVPLDINGAGCGDNVDGAKQTAAALWNLPESGATYRVSHILGWNADYTNELLAGVVRPYLDKPDDDSERNLWLIDHFYRDDTAHLGKYTTAGPAETLWSIIDDPELLALDSTKDRILTASGAGAIIAPLPRALGANERPWEVVVDLASNEDGDGLSKAQIGLHSASGVIGYVELEPTKATVATGGTLDNGTGVISTPTATFSANTSVNLGNYRVPFDVNPGDAEYTRFVVRVASDKIQIFQTVDGDYIPNDFNDLGAGAPLAEIALGGGGGAGVDTGLSAVSVGGDASFAVTTIAVFAAFPSEAPADTFIRADSNCDGIVDISDPINTLNVLFLGSGSICCPEASNANGDATTDLSDAVYSLSFSFQGGPPPPGPYPDCGGTGCPAHDECP
jgi:hypothetical protein